MSFQAAVPLQHCTGHYLSEWKEKVFDWMLLDGSFVLHREWKGTDNEPEQQLAASRFQDTTLRQNLLLLGPSPNHWWQSGVYVLNESSEERRPPGTDTFIMSGQRLSQKMMSRLFSARELQCPADKTRILWWMYIQSCPHCSLSMRRTWQSVWACPLAYCCHPATNLFV